MALDTHKHSTFLFCGLQMTTIVALNYTICKGTIPLGGARNPEQARQNAKALGWRLSDAEIAELDAVALVGKAGLFWQHG